MSEREELSQFHLDGEVVVFFLIVDVQLNVAEIELVC